MTTLPRFVPSGEPLPLGPPAAGGDATALDSFRIGSDGWPDGWRTFVVLDQGGQLRPVDATKRAALPSQAREQFALRELRGRSRVLVAVRSLYLMEISGVEQLPDAPGLDDPVWLAGTIFGPFALDGAEEPAPMAVVGKLAATRTEVLDGAALGFPHAFPAAAAARATPVDIERGIHHLLLSGGDEAALAAGTGVVIGYPAREEPPGAGNEAAMARLLLEVLAALREDARRAGGSSAAAALRLPDAPRGAAPHAEASVGGQPRTWWTTLLASFFETVPQPVADCRSLVTLSTSLLETLAGWPTSLAHALRATSRVTEALWTPALRLGIRPVTLAGDGPVREERDALVLSWWSIKSNEGKILFRILPDTFGEGGIADIEVEAECFDDRGSLALCYRAADGADVARGPTIVLEGTKTWRTLHGRCPRAKLDQSLWRSGDIGFQTTSDRDIRIRRLAVRVFPRGFPPTQPAGREPGIQPASTS